MPVSAPVSSRSRGAAAASAAAGLVASVSALIINRAWASGRVLPLVARHEPGPGVVPRAQAFAIGVSYPRLALAADALVHADYLMRDEWLRSLLGHLPLEAGVVVVVAGRTRPPWAGA